MPWRLIEGPESADAVAAEIGAAPYRRASRTSISGGLRFASGLFDHSGYRGLRRVIDVSGDGANNSGPLIAPTRDEVVAAGITINGLPIMLKRPYRGTMDIEHLDWYYEDCVIGGPGAFVVPIRDRAKFIEATRTKLVLEIAGRQPERARGAGLGARSRACPAPSASPCGSSAGAATISSDQLALERRHDLHVMRIAELVDRRDRADLVAAADQQRGVAREGGRIAGDRDHDRHRARRQLARLRLRALARRVEHHGVEAFQFSGDVRPAEQVALRDLHRLEAGGRCRRALERGDGAAVAVGGGDARGLGQPQGERPDAGEQVGDALGLADMRDAPIWPASLRPPRSPAGRRPAAAATWARPTLSSGWTRFARPARRGG